MLWSLREEIFVFDKKKRKERESAKEGSVNPTIQIEFALINGWRSAAQYHMLSQSSKPCDSYDTNMCLRQS